MTAQTLDGKALASQMRIEVAEQIARTGTSPGLVTVLVGDRPDSRAYVRNKLRACKQVGINGRLHELPETVTEEKLLEVVAGLNADPSVHGILVQMPLPDHIAERAVIESIHPLKDVDCFHPENVGLLAAGRPRFLPCTPAGIHHLLTRNGVELPGREVVIVGRSDIVGKPLALMWMQKPSAAHSTGGDATVTIVHTRTRDMAEITRRADVLVAAVGRPALITAEMVKPGAAVVDVGINAVGDKLVGDVAAEVAEVAGWLSPVPGGVGPMTVTMLMMNTATAAVRSGDSV